MDRSHIEKYKSEMMALYGKSREKPTSEGFFVSPEIEDVNENAPDDTAYEDFPQNDRDDTNDTEDEFNQRYPEPDLSDLDTDSGTVDESENETSPEYADINGLGDSIGYIQANVRAGDESSPVEGATVAVTAVVNGQRLILASGLTDRNGTSQKFPLPVPDTEQSQTPDAEIRPYNLFDVSVTADGYFPARSVDVPVFSGITSVQNFSMIPVPLMMNGRSETLTYYNSEPNYSEGGE